MADGKYWVTWKDESDPTAARNSAIIWGPQANPPPQLSGWFLAGAFATKADAEAYKAAIGRGGLLPPKGTPVFGGQHVPNPLSGIDRVGASLESFYDVITDGKLWRSVGWLVLGIILVTAGVYLWVRTSDVYKATEGAITGAVTKAV